MKKKNIMLLFILLLAAACSLQEELHPDNPMQPGTDPLRGEVRLTLQNKLVIDPPETRADQIASKAENQVDSLDVYVFGSLSEEGPYTYQERFSYRVRGTVPTDATPLRPDVGTGSVTASLTPKKGLFVKFYCVANQVDLVNKNGGDASPFVPLSQTMPGSIGNEVTPGSPTEEEFLEYTSPLLLTDGNALGVPLPMVGSNVSPLDLTAVQATGINNVYISLMRTVARFDIINDAKKSNFIIQSVYMENGRPGVQLFPITPIGRPITYPDSVFNGERANAGVVKGAYYTYPSPTSDQGYLVLKGRYVMNSVDTINNVTYPVSFRQVTDGNGATVEINPNHRYQIQITEAEPEKINFTIEVKDWEYGDELDDYQPDHSLDPIVFKDTAVPAINTYDPVTRTVYMRIKSNSTFNLSTASYSGVEAGISFGKNKEPWFEEVKETPDSRTATKAGKTEASFTYRLLDDAKEWPRGTITLHDLTGNVDSIIRVEPTFSAPDISLSKASEATNTFKNNVMTIIKRAKPGSITLSVFSPGGSYIENVPSIVTADTMECSEAIGTYTFTMTTGAVPPTTAPQIIFRSKVDPEQETVVTLLLKYDGVVIGNYVWSNKLVWNPYWYSCEPGFSIPSRAVFKACNYALSAQNGFIQGWPYWTSEASNDYNHWYVNIYSNAISTIPNQPNTYKAYMRCYHLK